MDEKTGISTAADLHQASHALPTQAHATTHAAPEILDNSDLQDPDAAPPQTAEELQERRNGRFSYLKTKNFYIVLLLGYRLRHPPFITIFILTLQQPGPRPLYHLHQHLFLPPRYPRHLYSRLSNFF